MTNNTQSSLLTQARLAGTVSYPHYDRHVLKSGIAHLGLGNFHRSHQARYIHKLLQAQAQDWMIHGIGMRESDKNLIGAMQSQDNLYTLTEHSGVEDTTHVIGSIKQSSYGPADVTAVIESLASNAIKIISLTVTEKGYSSNPSGDLNTADALIEHDLRNDDAPVTVLGYLFAVARQRKQQNREPFTVMSCDNLPGNGVMTGRLLLQFAALKDPDVAEWIRQNVSFPNSMVDRITPVTTSETKEYVKREYNIDDACPVSSESFTQWVLEDDFINGRPDFESVGVQLVSDVEPYERLKTRMLNGSHSALAYTAYLMGYRKVDEAMRDPGIEKFLTRYMNEDITPTIGHVPGVDLDDYKITLRRRFANPAISDQIQRLATDGSTKIHSFVVPPLKDALKNESSIKWMVFALAAWAMYLKGQDEQGNAIDVRDPRAKQLVGAIVDAPDLLSKSGVFPSELTKDIRLCAELNKAITLINQVGIRNALESTLTT